MGRRAVRRTVRNTHTVVCRRAAERTNKVRHHEESRVVVVPRVDLEPLACVQGVISARRCKEVEGHSEYSMASRRRSRRGSGVHVNPLSPRPLSPWRSPPAAVHPASVIIIVRTTSGFIHCPFWHASAPIAIWEVQQPSGEHNLHRVDPNQPSQSWAKFV
jgi:hypothetical protein